MLNWAWFGYLRNIWNEKYVPLPLIFSNFSSVWRSYCILDEVFWKLNPVPFFIDHLVWGLCFVFYTSWHTCLYVTFFSWVSVQDSQPQCCKINVSLFPSQDLGSDGSQCLDSELLLALNLCHSGFKEYFLTLYPDHLIIQKAVWTFCGFPQIVRGAFRWHSRLQMWKSYMRCHYS